MAGGFNRINSRKGSLSIAGPDYKNRVDFANFVLDLEPSAIKSKLGGRFIDKSLWPLRSILLKGLGLFPLPISIAELKAK